MLETFCGCRIFEQGVESYCEKGIPDHQELKIISVNIWLQPPGIYEIEWGMTVAELLRA